MWWILLITFIDIVVAERIVIKRPDSRMVRITGTETTSIENYPFVVQLVYNGEDYKDLCSGVLVTKRQVISVAHCISDNNVIDSVPQAYTVRAGSARCNKDGTVHRVEALIKHPRFNPNTLQNDICVLLISTPVVYSPKVQPAYLPPQGYVVADDSDVIIVGWGVTDPKISAMTSTENLMHVTFKSVNNDACAAQYKPKGGSVTKDMICAGLSNVVIGKDNCHGDSGGPLVFGGVVVGLLSFSIGCADPGLPVVSTRLAAHINWIEGMIETGNLLISAEMSSDGPTRWQPSLLLLTISVFYEEFF